MCGLSRQVVSQDRFHCTKYSKLPEWSNYLKTDQYLLHRLMTVLSIDECTLYAAQPKWRNEQKLLSHSLSALEYHFVWIVTTLYMSPNVFHPFQPTGRTEFRPWIFYFKIDTEVTKPQVYLKWRQKACLVWHKVVYIQGPCYYWLFIPQFAYNNLCFLFY